MKKRNIGSSFDSWLREEGVYEEVTATAIKRVLADRALYLTYAMRRRKELDSEKEPLHAG
jgi:hypothetical protein